MVQVSYPGVYLFEVPPTVRPIGAVATSIAVFIDYFREGPTDRAVQIFGMADFERVFGGLDADSAASYSIAQFFLNGGSIAYVIRVITGSAASIGTASIGVNGGSGAAIMTITAKSPGKWGNDLRATVEPSDDPGAFNLTVLRYRRDSSGRSIVGAAERYVNLNATSTSSRFYKKVVNDESLLVDVDTAGAGGSPATTGTLGKAIAATFPATGNKALLVDLNTSPPTRSVTVNGPFPDVRQLRTKLEAALQGAIPGVSVELVPATGGGVRLWLRLSSRAPGYQPDTVITVAGADAGFFGLTSGGGYLENVQEYSLGATGAAATKAGQVAGAEGKNGDPPDATSLKGNRGEKSGLYRLEDVDLFNILCIPRAALLANATEMQSVYSDAVAYCEERRAFLLIDVPKDVNSLQKAKDFIDDNAMLRDKNAAIYFPLVEVPDPLDEFRLKAIGASGTMAGLYARTDAERGVWKAPAGVDANLRGVSELGVKLTDLQNGQLNPIAVNCLRTFPVYGSIAWGARTLDGADVKASEWKYVPVRRLALMIEESLFRGTKWVVFEPNDEPLWAKIRLNVGNFMLNLFRQGAFQGDTPSKAFFVKCDGETTTAIDRNLGVVNIEVGFAPLKPAEFVVIKIQQIPDVT